MSDNDALETILNCSDLSSHQKGEVVKYLKGAGITSLELDSLNFNQNYRNVVRAVEKIKSPYEKILVRLDSETSNTNLTYHEVIGVEDENIQNIFEIRNDEKRKSLHNLYGNMKYFFSEISRKVICPLIKKTDRIIFMFLRQILKKIFLKQNSVLEKLAKNI